MDGCIKEAGICQASLMVNINFYLHHITFKFHKGFCNKDKLILVKIVRLSCAVLIFHSLKSKQTKEMYDFPRKKLNTQRV